MRFSRLVMMLALFAVLSVAVLPVLAQDAPQVVNVYSSRHYGAMEAVFVRFTEETGIDVRISQGSSQSLLERLRAEGEQTPADVFFTIDAGGLQLAADEGLLQPVESDVLTEAIPEELRDPENRWFGVGQRFRTLMYSTEVVDPEAEGLNGYEDLADPKWNGRLCLRPATHIYTISLVASLIAEYGEAEAEEIVAGWVANNPEYIDSDTTILETIAAGGCDVGITNHYYLARKYNEDPNFPVSILWANQDERGVHRNVSGMGVTAAALNYDNAVTLIEWMATEGQAADETGLPGGGFEYPVAAEAEIVPVLETFGEFTIDPLPLAELGANQEAAVALLERTGYGF
jgi:iron(III) transport system substrate-binding protein